jgi:hypothetical protein
MALKKNSDFPGDPSIVANILDGAPTPGQAMRRRGG